MGLAACVKAGLLAKQGVIAKLVRRGRMFEQIWAIVPLIINLATYGVVSHFIGIKRH